MKCLFLNKWKFIFFLFLIVSYLFTACSYFNKYPGYSKAESGLLYKFHNKKDGKKANIGDFITVEIKYQSNEDSLTFENNGNIFSMEMIMPVYAGDINEALAMMSQGDSATFVIRADSFLLNNAHLVRLPDFIDDRSRIIFDVKLHKIQSPQELELERELEFTEALKKESDAIQEYLANNNYQTKALNSGLYFIELKKGRGISAVDKQVSVHYTGKFLDGSVFDSSYSRGKPIEFNVGSGQVIRGWDEGIAKMRKGGKALLLIPSKLGYGSGRGLIPPYTPLLFEVELIDVK
ncbi:MAG: FKBP-type peptidyl-prolyl cis-trans isomerase [Bacteroidota bacterium]